MEDARGQSYDGAGAMMGKHRGVSTRIRKRYPKMPTVHCHCHRLNLSVMKMSKVSLVRDLLEQCRCIADFFGNSSKRTDFFKQNLVVSEVPKNDHKTLINICRTR